MLLQVLSAAEVRDTRLQNSRPLKRALEAVAGARSPSRRDTAYVLMCTIWHLAHKMIGSLTLTAYHWIDKNDLSVYH
jgi:hypothetical protein